jgi:hypothetical protein
VQTKNGGILPKTIIAAYEREKAVGPLIGRSNIDLSKQKGLDMSRPR